MMHFTIIMNNECSILVIIYRNKDSVDTDLTEPGDFQFPIRPRALFS